MRRYLVENSTSYFDKSDISNLNEGEVVELAGNLRNGVPIATPVFDGAHENDIVEMLEKG